MNNTENKQHRYPGAKPFEAQDKAIFFGREEDTRKLRELISVEKMVVLYGKSGLGKSSLLNAGVLPLLTDYCIIPIRIQAKADKIAAPLDTVLAKIDTKLDGFEDSFIETFASDLAPIWAKLNALQNAQNPLCICLVFDQFEELFTHEKADIFRFKTALAEAFFEKIPQKVRNRWEKERANMSEKEQKQLFQPIELKLIFGIREDKMGFLDSLKDVFPNILQKTYKLAPLNRAQAEEAILYPAYAKETDYKVPPFDYEDEALDAILDTLSNNRQEIESPQLQIICRHAESLVENDKVLPNDKGRKVIQRSDLGDLNQVYRDYYLNMLSEIANATERQNVQEVIENELIYEPDERRIPCFESVILDKGVSPETLRWLVSEHHILRAEPNVGGGFTYELSHDILVKPILAVKKVRIAEAAKIRLEQEKMEAERKEKIARTQAEQDRILRAKAEKATKRATLFSIVAGALAIVAVVAFLWAFFQKEVAEKEKLKTDSALAQVRIQEAKNKKIIDASYFYADRFGMAVKKDQSTHWETKYGFINKEGDTLIGYRYSYAQPFDEETGFAFVKKKENDIELLYFIDTLKNEYRLAYKPSDDKNIVALDLRGKNLDSIPAKVFKMTQLKVLLLGRNKLRKIPEGLENMKALQSLDISGNQISKLEGLENLKALQSLNISGNQISKLERLENLKALQSLNISGNQISKLEGLENLKALQTFDISSNQVSKLEGLDNLKALQTFNINGNKITKLEGLDNLKVLQDFYIEKNQITKLEGLDNLKALQTFAINGNNITKLEGLDNLKALQKLYIYENQIDTLLNLDNLKALQLLSIYSNQIIKLEGLDNLKALQTLDINGNKITKLEGFDNLKALQTFNINGNKITKLEGLDNLKVLQDFYIEKNQITKLEGLDNLKALQTFAINGNNITKLEGLDNLKALQKLYIYENQIDTLQNLDNLKTLQLLSIYSNQIIKLEGLDNLKALQTFDINGNKITKLEGLDNLKTLQTFNINGNKITKLEGLDNLKALQDFYIEKNQITKLEGLDNLKALKSCYFEGNKVTEIASSFWESSISNSIDYLQWIQSCGRDRNYALVLTIRKGLQTKKLDLNHKILSWVFIFCHDFEGAIWAGEKYVEKGGKEIRFLSNLAIGYLYNGDYDKTYTIYAKYKNMKDDSGLGKEIFLKDLTEVAAANVPPANPADVEKIKAFLQAE